VDVTVTGKYSVRAISEGGTCSQTSNIVEVVVSSGTLSGTPVATNNGPLCVGSPLNLQVNDVGATEYRWRGPAGYTATGRTPTLANFQPENVGRYYVDIVIGTCVAATVSTVVEAIDIGSFQVTYPGSAVICQGDSKTLSVSPVLGGTTFQWYESGTGILSGETNPTLTVTTSGNYYVRATYPGCSPIDTEPVQITCATFPVSNFTMPSDACLAQLVLSPNDSTVASDVTPTFHLNFVDGNTPPQQIPQHPHPSARPSNVPVQDRDQDLGSALSPAKAIDVQTEDEP